MLKCINHAGFIYEVDCHTIGHSLSTTLPDLLGWIPFADDRILLTVQTSVTGGKVSLGRLVEIIRVWWRGGVCSFQYGARSRWEMRQTKPNRDLRWLGLVTLLLSPTASDAARLGAAFGHFGLTARCGQRVFARTATLPWNRDGRCRALSLRLHIRRLDPLDVAFVLIQFLDFGQIIRVEGGCGAHPGRGVGGVRSVRQSIM